MNHPSIAREQEGKTRVNVGLVAFGLLLRSDKQALGS